MGLRSTLLAVITIASTTLVAQQEEKIDYNPDVFGAVKAKFELSTVNGQQRFNVRNSRIGVKGLVSNQMSYAIQIDFNNEGNISILDSYVGYTLGGFTLTLGQQQYKFSTDLDRGPSSNMFSNRSFIAKYITTYYGSDYDGNEETFYVRSIGSRDIGALITYDFPDAIPLKISFGGFNGSGINNPEWSRTTNFVAKVVVGSSRGLAGSLSYYGGNTPVETKVVSTPDGAINQKFRQNINMYGAELRYLGRNFLIESEYAQRRLNGDNLETLHAAHVHGYYKFQLPTNRYADYISPLLRWDIGRGIDFMDTATKLHDKFNAHRLTAAINIGLSEKVLRSELRFGYEKFFVYDRPVDFRQNQLLHDKMTIEFVASF